jgi:hypothetical protein
MFIAIDAINSELLSSKILPLLEESAVPKSLIFAEHHLFLLSKADEVNALSLGLTSDDLPMNDNVGKLFLFLLAFMVDLLVLRTEETFD